jgi:hypothetical protein
MRPRAALFAAALALSPLLCPAGPLEALVEALPAEKIDRAAGFFGPVVKKYLPDMNALQAEYERSPEKVAVIARYMPKIEAALADAKAMRVPPRYEAEKAEYIRIASSLVASLRLLCKFHKGGQ